MQKSGWLLWSHGALSFNGQFLPHLLFRVHCLGKRNDQITIHKIIIVTLTLLLNSRSQMIILR